MKLARKKKFLVWVAWTTLHLKLKKMLNCTEFEIFHIRTSRISKLPRLKYFIQTTMKSGNTYRDRTLRPINWGRSLSYCTNFEVTTELMWKSLDCFVGSVIFCDFRGNHLIRKLLYGRKKRREGILRCLFDRCTLA